MNPSVSCSSEERGEDNSWVCESWENPAVVAPINAMSVGLETARQFHGRVDWDWDNSATAAAAATVNNNNNTTTNPLLQRHHHHHHHHHHEQSDSDDQKPHIALPPPMAPHTVASFRQYNGMGLGYSGQQHHHHALGMLNSSGMRSFGDSNSGLPSSSSSSFHQSLLYPEMPSFAYGACDSRSQLAQMMSLQNHHNKHGAAAGATVFHDIVKREDLEYQATMLNLGHRAYFSSEDSAVSRLYKRSRALPPSSQAPRCQAEGCKTDLTNAKHYHRRHKVCEFHSKAATVVTGGVHQRFCQQCSRFHALSEFDDAKRSCRKRLADHNRRRRKPQPNAVTSNTETPTAALKAEEDDHSHSNKNGSGSSDTTRGVQVSPGGRTESQALMSAMSLPLMLQNSKGQMSPNPNASSANCNANPNPNGALQQHSSSHKECQQQQQYSQNGPNLSMGLCNQRTQAQQEYSGLELALPWLRPGSEYSSSHHHRPSTPMDILQPIMSEKSDVEGYSSSIQNFLPLSTSSSRDMGGSSQWMVGNSDHESGHEHEQQMFSLLESPAAVRTEEDSSAAVEYLSHRRHHHHHHHHQGGLGLNSKDGTMQSLRPFGQSIYDSTL